MQTRHWRRSIATLAFAGLLAAVGPVRADGLIISEFLASNDKILADEDGDYSDWIEIHNVSLASVNLAGWYLTDDEGDLTKWQFPSVTLPGGGYLVVFASDKNRTNPAGELHTSFKLSAAAEYLGLIRPDGVTAACEFWPDYPAQYTDVSYGVHEAAGYWYLDPPTPGMVNTASTAYAGVSAAIEWSQPGGTFTAPLALELSGPAAGTIRYTLDGTLPTEASPVYTGPITLSETTWVRARACEPALLPGPVVSQVYLALAADVADFTSNLPLVVVDTFGFDIDSEWNPSLPRPLRPAMAVFIDTGAGDRAAIVAPADYSGYAGIHVRGHSSASLFEKKQYKLETWDEYADDLVASVLGFPADSDWVLYAPYSDKTLMRNLLAYKWSNDIGRYAVRTRCIEVFMNTDGDDVSADDYAGVYVFMESIKRGDQRVNIAKLDSGDDAEPEITGGYIIKKDRLDLADSGFWTMKLGQLAYDEPSEAEITPEQAAWLSNWLTDFETVLMSADFDDPVNGYAKYIDVDSFIDHHIMVEMVKNIDGFKLSTYMYKDRNGKLNMGPVWDYNLSTGNADYSDYGIYTYHKATGWYYETGIGEAYNWYARLMQDPEFRIRYADRWFALREGVLSTEHVLGDIDRYAVLLAEAAERNFDRWQLYVSPSTGHEGGPGGHVWASILNAWVWPNWYHGTPNNPHTYTMEVEWLKTWLAGNGEAPGEYSDRLWWFDHNLASGPPPVFNQDGGRVDSGFVLTMENAAGTSGAIYYTLDGSDPRMPAQPPTVLIPESATKRALVPTGALGQWAAPAFDDSAWPSGSGGVGFERSPGDPVNYTDLIDFDVESTMYGQNATCYIRIPFTVDGPALDALSSLSLNVRYDDAFVAYLNGSEIARSAYIPSRLEWDSAATGYHDDSLAVLLESFDVSAGLGYLVAGDNLLAIQALNSSSTSSDFLVSAELTGTPVGNDISPTALSYDVTGPVTLTSSVGVRARTLDGDSWSAVNDARFTVGPITLFINEFMADNEITIEDPDETGEYPDWLELYNPGPFAVDLGGMYLTDDLAEPTQSPIPAGVSIDAGQTLVFWADGDTEQGPLHTSFKLSKSGEEEIGLFDTAEYAYAMIDAVVFGSQDTDVSDGRLSDGVDCWIFFDAPTPGASNGLLYDSELDGDVDLDDFDTLATCLGGPNVSVGEVCVRFDGDCDGDVDLLDFAGFEAAFTGACE
jgi:hypothetical protein